MLERMRILITNVGLDTRSGTSLYVRDLALQLLRIGHEPTVYTKSIGAVAREMHTLGVRIVTRLSSLSRAPDVIHAHHTVPTLDALRCFPRVPAIFVCHDHTSFFEQAVIDPRIRRYYGVSKLCVARLVRDGVEAGRAQLLTNFVDTRRFEARDGLPAEPRRALIFSNYARRGTHLPAVAAACQRKGLYLDVIGEAAGNAVAAPESVLGRYDIVFAKAKAAMEAMATGAAVVLCDFGGVGPAVSSENFELLRPLNFGFEALVNPLTAGSVLRQIDRYDPQDAARVCTKLRAVANLQDAVDTLCAIYSEVVAEPLVRTVPPVSKGNRPDAVRNAAHRLWLGLPPSGRTLLRRAPGVRSLMSKLRAMRF
jgi:hypothetical protein